MAIVFVIIVALFSIKGYAENCKMQEYHKCTKDMSSPMPEDISLTDITAEEIDVLCAWVSSNVHLSTKLFQLLFI